MERLLRDHGGHKGGRTPRRELLNPGSVYLRHHNRKRMQRACFLEGKLQLGSCTSSCPAPSWSHHALDALGLARAEVPRPSSPSAPCGCSTARVSVSPQVGAVRQEVPEPAPDEEICLQAAGRDLGRLLQAEHPRCHQLRGPGGGKRGGSWAGGWRGGGPHGVPMVVGSLPPAHPCPPQGGHVLSAAKLALPSMPSRTSMSESSVTNLL